ncbi:glycosyltransferase family 2 protein [Motilibacter aurantiacus]|uniref:glycosyltransferase family 2 protein n=1 Tax=Motilibacter aurantiacus TaxID=2714955 RepID=UPI00140D7DB0|nr:glycosyltransferase family 2 protein [Motilibacter aurantiacus]
MSRAAAAPGTGDRLPGERAGGDGSAAPLDVCFDVCVVIVAFHSAADLPGCLSSVRTALAGLEAAVVVVDNASDDGAQALVRRDFPEVTFVQLLDNRGFAGGCHVGSGTPAARRSRRLLFVNPDARLEPGAVRELLAAAARHPRPGIVGGLAVRADGSPDPRSWCGRPTLWSTFCFATGLSTVFAGSALLDPESSGPWRAGALAADRAVPAVSGAVMLVERGLWDTVDGFDRSFFVYGEDVDLCLRASALGASVVFAPAARYSHQVGASSVGLRRAVLLFTGKVTLVRRHLPQPVRPLGAGLLLAGVALRACASRLAAVRRRTGSGHGGRSGREQIPLGFWAELWRARGEWMQGWTSTVTGVQR